MLRSSGFSTVRKLTKNLPPEHMLLYISTNLLSIRIYGIFRKHIFIFVTKKPYTDSLMIIDNCTVNTAYLPYYHHLLYYLQRRTVLGKPSIYVVL